jgi:hypothetical protein
LIEKLMAGVSKDAGAAKKMNANLKINTNASMRSSTPSQANMATTVAAVSTSALKRPLSNRSVTFADWKQREQYDQQVDAWRGEKPFERTRLEPGEDESALSTDQSSIMLTPLNRVRVNRTRVAAATTSLGSDLASRQVPRDESALSTDQSSIMLTPLNRVRVNRTRVAATTTTSSSDLLGSRQAPRVEMRVF